MKIYSMTATFGKLEHETLTLQPGLNIIQAPNEWGKSTWCAFLVAMLYGVDTRAKSTKTVLADKERYAPWSGSPMEGRIDLSWQGRDITIERRTKGRIPLGLFSAYETATGLPVPELTAANCGQTLLGVERSVFLRSAFIRQAEMPVSNDDALRRRLNALVSTGDESGSGEKLAKELKNLKNRCRYNRTGLLPQAEGERDALEEKLREMTSLEEQLEKLDQRLESVNDWLARLENHRLWLKYADARTDADRVAEAKAACDAAQRRLTVLEEQCAGVMEPERIEQMLVQLEAQEKLQQSLQVEIDLTMPEIMTVEPPEVFADMSGWEALRQARDDRELYESLHGRLDWLVILGTVLMLAGFALMVWFLIPGLVLAGVGLVCLAVAMIQKLNCRRTARELEHAYGSPDPKEWVETAERYAEEDRAAAESRVRYMEAKEYFRQKQEQQDQVLQQLTQGRGLEACRKDLYQQRSLWAECLEARRDCRHRQAIATELAAMVKTVEEPRQPDSLTFTREETERLLTDGRAEQQQLHSRMGQYRGRMDSLGSKEEARQQLDRINRRIRTLEDTFQALTVAQETLAEASARLQRRFAPQISKRAQELMKQLTDGRYDRVQLGENMTLQTGAEREDTLRETLWRSDGTVDQLYLALRLAVAEALSPCAPLILDDALVRFDDRRMKAALTLFSRMAQEKQVLLFTCQSRERDARAAES